jgi:hypothetical protein
MRREISSLRRLVVNRTEEKEESSAMKQNRAPSLCWGFVLTHSGKAGFFCNDASQTRASHFSANQFYKRHLDKKLHLASWLERLDMRWRSFECRQS